MALTTDDIKALRLLIREECGDAIEPFKEEMRAFREETAANFDSLFRRDEKREQEYLSLRESVSRLEKKVA